MGPSDTTLRWLLVRRAAMFITYPPWTSWLVGEVLGNGWFPNALIKILVRRFWAVRQDVEGLSTDKRIAWGLHSFMAHLALVVDPVPVLNQLALLGVDLDGTVHIFHLLLYIPVELYSTARHLFAFRGNLPIKGLPMVVEMLTESFAVRRVVHVVTQADHISHLGESHCPIGIQCRACGRGSS